MSKRAWLVGLVLAGLFWAVMGFLVWLIVHDDPAY